jgi:hypothetical protein
VHCQFICAYEIDLGSSIQFLEFGVIPKVKSLTFKSLNQAKEIFKTLFFNNDLQFGKFRKLE